MSSLPPPAPPGPPGPPPAYPGPPGYSPGPPAAYKDLHKLSRAILILLTIYAGLQIIALPVLLSVRTKALDYLHGRISRETFRDAVNTQTAVSFPANAIHVAIAVLSIIWLYRLIENNRALGRPGAHWTPGWAIAGWFTPPGFGYVIPWLIFNELWKGSDPVNTPNDPTWKQRRLSPVTTVWWIVYGFTPILSFIVAIKGISFANFDRDSMTDRMARNYRDVFGLQFTAAILTVVGAAVYFKLVHDLTRRQQALTGER